MLNIEQFRCGDNLSYLIYGKKEAMAIDGVAWQGIIAFLGENDLTLTVVTNTHGHCDHTFGNDELLKLPEARLLKFADLEDNREIQIDGGKIVILRTPGHTVDSVCFYTGTAIISGDTLFNATIGNCDSGDLKSFYLSIKRLMTLPGETLVYAGHDYIQDSLAFARYLEPDNKNIDNFRNFYDYEHVYSTMSEERRTNPYMRFNDEAIISLLKKRGLPSTTEWERWQSLMSID
jgi:hydroxyacylglutathione hydrolase